MKQIVIIGLTTVILWALGLGTFILNTQALFSDENLPEHAQAIVILTGGEGRITHGLDLFKAGLAQEVLISGVHPNTSDPTIFEQNNIDLGQIPCCVTLGRAAKSTAENAIETREWLQERHYNRFILVTSDYHMLRAKMELKFEIPDAQITVSPVPEVYGHIDNPETFYIIIREYNKFLYRACVLIFRRLTENQE
jgi:uncharacterized SAM-binding protein YcdF (DUF218 family)